MNRSKILSRRNSQGFTVIELMVATAVFSLVLVVVTAGILQVSRLYYKGVTSANTQSTARSVIDTVAQAIQFGGGTVLPTSGPPASPTAPKVFCVGNQRFTYDLGWQAQSVSPNSSKHQAYHALVQDTLGGACNAGSTQPLDVPGVLGRELLGPNMRLAKFDVTSLSGNKYRIAIKIVYGDDDLLKGGPDNDPTTDPGSVSCVNETSGTQFCSVIELSTVVTKRVQ